MPSCVQRTVSALHDPVTGALLGLMGANGKEYYFPAAAVGLPGVNPFDGDQQKWANDTSPMRTGCWSLLASGALYTLVGDLVMWYWSHNTPIDPNTGNFLGRDDTGPCMIHVITEGTGTNAPMFSVYTSASAAAGNVPTFNLVYQLNATTGAVRLGNVATGYRAVTLAADTQLDSDSTLTYSFAGAVTETLLPAASVPGRVIRVRSVNAATVLSSASSNVVPLAGGAAGTTILLVGGGKWADLQSDGANWQITANN